jgi:hypothetical protein
VPQSTLIGAVRFDANSLTIASRRSPGVYTMRLAYQPDIGEHENTARTPSSPCSARAQDRSPEPIRTWTTSAS